MENWQKPLGSEAKWWNIQIQVNPTYVSGLMGHPVYKESVVIITPVNFDGLFSVF